MNLSRFIALRIYRNSEPGKQVSRPAVLIAMVGIALGLAVYDYCRVRHCRLQERGEG